jgi:phage shock protein A
MSETIASRVGRLITGSLNAIIDAAENASPEIVMQQSIREIESVINEIRAELGKEAVSIHMLESRLAGEKEKHQTLAEQTLIALNEGRDDLAEVAVSKQMDIEAQLPVMEKNLLETTNRIKELEGYIAALQAKKREMQEEYELFKKKKQQTPNATSDTPEAKVDKAQAAFERVMGVSASAPGNTDEAKLAELDALARQNRIKERLESLKAQK